MRNESPLTERQTEVLALVAQNKQAKEIARLLGCEHRSVEGHMLRLRKRLGVSSRIEAVAIAVRAGWI